MNLIDLIQSDKEQAQSAIADLMQSKVFDYLDNYVLESDSIEELDEAIIKGSVKKDAKGNVVTFKSVPDKKSAVVAGSVKKDNKGNVLSFKTEDYEAMDQEEFAAVVENFDQLDELSKDTLKSYVKKASSSQEDTEGELSSAKTAAKNYGGKFSNLASKLQNKVQKRASGIASASKLTEESLDEMSQDEFDAVLENYEQLDELSKDTLGSYIKKANHQRGNNYISDLVADNRGAGVMKAADRLAGDKSGPLKAAASDARWSKSHNLPSYTKKKQKFDSTVDKLTKESLDEMSQDEFDAVVENFEQLDELSKATLGSYIKKANDRRGDKDVSDHEFDNRSLGVMKAADKLVGRKTFGGLKGLASDAHWAKSKGHFYANREKQTFDTAVDKLVKKK